MLSWKEIVPFVSNIGNNINKTLFYSLLWIISFTLWNVMIYDDHKILYDEILYNIKQLTVKRIDVSHVKWMRNSFYKPTKTILGNRISIRSSYNYIRLSVFALALLHHNFSRKMSVKWHLSSSCALPNVISCSYHSIDLRLCVINQSNRWRASMPNHVRPFCIMCLLLLFDTDLSSCHDVPQYFSSHHMTRFHCM